MRLPWNSQKYFFMVDIMDNFATLKKLFRGMLYFWLFFYQANLAAAKNPSPSPTEKASLTKPPAKVSDTEAGPSHISANPAAVEATPGSGVAQQYIEKAFGIKNNYGFNFSGAWLGDGDQLLSGGVSDAKHLTGNSLLLVNLTWDPEKTTPWKGALFGAEFLQLNAQNTNGQAGVVQGYNSLPGPPPLTRSELYQLWYRQKLFNDKLIVRVGKLIPTVDFNNVIKPVPIGQGAQFVPSVTGLIYPALINFRFLLDSKDLEVFSQQRT